MEELLLGHRLVEERVALGLAAGPVHGRAFEVARGGRPGGLRARLFLLAEVGVVVCGQLLDVSRVLEQLLLLGGEDFLAARGVLAAHPQLVVVLAVLLATHLLFQVAVPTGHQRFLQLEVVVQDFLRDAHLELRDGRVRCL